MITISELEYELNESSMQTFSRLSWAVEKIESSWTIWNSNIDTNRPWQGIIDEKNLVFEIEEADGLFRKKFKILAKGSISNKESKSIVNIKLGLNNITSFGILITFIASLFFIIVLIFENSVSAFVLIGLWLVIYPVIGAFTIKNSLSRAESKLDELFS